MRAFLYICIWMERARERGETFSRVWQSFSSNFNKFLCFPSFIEQIFCANYSPLSSKCILILDAVVVDLVECIFYAHKRRIDREKRNVWKILYLRTMNYSVIIKRHFFLRNISETEIISISVRCCCIDILIFLSRRWPIFPLFLMWAFFSASPTLFNIPWCRCCCP